MLDSSFRIHRREDLDKVLDGLEKVSDYYFCDNEPIKATVQGKTHIVSRRAMDAADMERLVVILGDESGGLYQNLKTKAKPRDLSYVTRVSGVRHRVNLTVNSAKQRKSIRVVMRRLESEPWALSRLRIPPGLIEVAYDPEPGLVMVLGATGSGKTSLLSGLLRAVTTKEGESGHVVTIEDPVEYTYDRTAGDDFVVSQIEVGVGCQNFADGLRAAMRMHPTHILVGEIRDPETAAAAIAAARSGHKVFATMHVSSVAEMFGRWSDFFPPGGELRAMNDLAAVIDYAVYQTLEDTEKGFMPVQESLSIKGINRTDFVTMIGNNIDNIFKVMEGFVFHHGITHWQDRLACNPAMAKQVAEQDAGFGSGVRLDTDTGLPLATKQKAPQSTVGELGATLMDHLDECGFVTSEHEAIEIEVDHAPG